MSSSQSYHVEQEQSTQDLPRYYHETSMRFESVGDGDRDVIPELVETAFPLGGSNSSPNRNMFYGYGGLSSESTDSLVSLADEEMIMARMMMGDIEE